MEKAQREREIIRLAQLVLAKNEAYAINDRLRGAKGLDYISAVLEEFGLAIGKRIKKDIFSLLREKDQIQNAVIKGSYEGMLIIPVRAN